MLLQNFSAVRQQVKSDNESDRTPFLPEFMIRDFFWDMAAGVESLYKMCLPKQKQTQTPAY